MLVELRIYVKFYPLQNESERAINKRSIMSYQFE